MLNKKQFYHKLPTKKAEKYYWPNLVGCGPSFSIATSNLSNPLIIITPDVSSAIILEQELKFFLGPKSPTPVLVFPDWETLPYDHFSPHEDVISKRLLTLYKLPKLESGIVIVAANTLMQRLPPKSYVQQNSFVLETNENLNINDICSHLDSCQYTRVSKVMAHGEFAVRGSIIDLFPMGVDLPIRIDLFDTKIDSIRFFDVVTQRSLGKTDKIQILPAKEYPLDDEAVSRFRQSWRSRFGGDPLRCPAYQSTINSQSHPGIEYYLPLFFEQTASLFDYLPKNSTIMRIGDTEKIMQDFWHSITQRYDQLCHDLTHPLVVPQELFFTVDQTFAYQNSFPQVLINPDKTYKDTHISFETKELPNIRVNHKAKKPLGLLQDLLKKEPDARVLFIAQSPGRLEILLELLAITNIEPKTVKSWSDFAVNSCKYAITTAKTKRPLNLNSQKNEPQIIIITEAQLFGEQTIEHTPTTTSLSDPQAVVSNLIELQVGAPVVHIDHGVGRYIGLQKLTANGYETEFLVLEYADNSKLYVPVSSLNLISRYTGANTQTTPLDSLGSKHWEKTKSQAKEKIRDVAVELLEIHARRANAKGFSFEKPGLEYEKFSSSFVFDETPDQKKAINDVIFSMTQGRPMDRLVCGDVGFGKTEVAMRAAFLAVYSGKQVAILVPTTVLAQQHFTNFHDRFIDSPIKIALLLGSRASKAQKPTIDNLASGKIDIVIGTHSLLQKRVQFKNLGLVIIDEEHRFGVKQKEHLKSIAPNIDILKLTATPIPRTLSMAFADIYDFSIISSPPAKRLAIKTFIHKRENYLIKESITRELARGGQVYFVHNNVATIEKTARELQQLIPNAKIAIGHGQMPKQKLEQVMHDFCNMHTKILVCTTIIESGLDIPTANTIIIDRADRFGLAQLHQLRGRVGRSHHQAYAYLITPDEASMTPDAKKRLEAISSMEDLGAGFVLATHDLEIRGAGELLGDKQSGEIHSIGFSLYLEMLEQAVTALKTGKTPEEIAKIDIDLQLPALIPDRYVDDANLRLVLYKKISGCKNKNELDEMRSEMIDRFGQLPEFAKNLFKISGLKLEAQELGITKITAGKTKGTVEFCAKPNIELNKIIKLIQKQPNIYKLRGSSKIEFRLEADSTKIDFIKNLFEMLG